MITEAALKLILDSEGLDQPSKHPGGESGITIGIGDDLGYQTLERFTRNWKGRLSESDFNRLKAAIGVKGTQAAKLAPSFKGITIKYADALEVFKGYDIPQYYKLTAQTFPGLEKLCDNARSVLVSLVFNRGASLSGPRRKEMLKIKTLIQRAANPPLAETYRAIAQQFREMKRLWVGKGLNGLLTRRENEARLIESCAF